MDEVECILKTVFDPTSPIEMCVVNESLVTTPWHPIKNENGQWVFPIESNALPVMLHVDAVYSFLLKSRGTILIGDYECATLAHGIQGDVIGHEYLGEEGVARDLKQFESFESGVIEVTSECFKRDAQSGRVVAIEEQ